MGSNETWQAGRSILSLTDSSLGALPQAQQRADHCTPTRRYGILRIAAWTPSVNKYLVRQSHGRLKTLPGRALGPQEQAPLCCTQLDPAAGRCEESTSQDLVEWSSPSQRQQSFSSIGRRFQMRSARLPAWSKGFQTTSIPMLQVSCIPARTTQHIQKASFS